jgi:hypothetical protein
MCVATLGLILAASCASSGAGTKSAGDEPDVRPRMISRLTPPMLRIPSIPASGRAPIRVRFEVLIDTEGQPDMSTFRVTGWGAAENRDALASWIQQSMFTPASRGGIAVPGVYRGSLQVRVVR